jgi:hypothetical protein
MSQPDNDKPEPRPRNNIRFDQLIRGHAIRAAAMFLANDEKATEGKLFDLSRRIAHYIEGRRRDGP